VAVRPLIEIVPSISASSTNKHQPQKQTHEG
jgi:hypothetical protein